MEGVECEDTKETSKVDGTVESGPEGGKGDLRRQTETKGWVPGRESRYKIPKKQGLEGGEDGRVGSHFGW